MIILIKENIVSNKVLNKRISLFTHWDNKLILCVDDQISNPRQ